MTLVADLTEREVLRYLCYTSSNMQSRATYQVLEKETFESTKELSL